MGYALRKFATPALSGSWSNIDSDATLYTSWQSIGTIERPSVAFSALWDGAAGAQLNMPHNSWIPSAYIQLGRSDGDSVQFSQVAIDAGSSGNNAFGGMLLSKPISWASGSLTHCRMAVALWRAYPGLTLSSLEIAIPAGSFWLYSYSEDDFAAEVAASFDPKNFAVVSGGKAGQRITRLRYKLAQTLAGDMTWGGTVSGTELHQF